MARSKYRFQEVAARRAPLALAPAGTEGPGWLSWGGAGLGLARAGAREALPGTSGGPGTASLWAERWAGPGGACACAGGHQPGSAPRMAGLGFGSSPRGPRSSLPAWCPAGTGQLCSHELGDPGQVAWALRALVCPLGEAVGSEPGGL